MKRFLVSLAWIAWLSLVTVVVIVMDGILNPGNAAPQSTVLRLLGFYGRDVVSMNGDASLLAWAWERIFPAHLLAWLLWRAFKAVALR